MIRKVVLATAMIFLLIAVIPFASRAQLGCGDYIVKNKVVQIWALVNPDGSSAGVSVFIMDQAGICARVKLFATAPAEADTTVSCTSSDASKCINVGAAPPQKVVGMTTLKNFFQEAGMSKKHAQELVNKTVREIKLKKPGEEGERLIRLITQQPSPTKPRKLATKWAKMKTKY